jgi:hypothetical protein
MLVGGCDSNALVNAEPQKVSRPRFTLIEGFLGLVLLFMFFRFTAVLVLIILALLYAFFPRHRSRRALTATLVIFVAALLVPVDVYIPGFHGPLMHSKHSGLRFVRVVYGYGARPRDGGEAISGGCVVGIHDTRWRLAWD